MLRPQVLPVISFFVCLFRAFCLLSSFFPRLCCFQLLYCRSFLTQLPAKNCYFRYCSRIAWQAQHLAQISRQPQGLRKACADFAAGVALSQGQVQISWQAQRFHKLNLARRIVRSLEEMDRRNIETQTCRKSGSTDVQIARQIDR